MADVKSLARESDRVDVLARLDRLATDSRSRWGSLTAPRMICHLSDAFRMALGERSVEPRDTWVTRGPIKWLALYAPLPWPRGVPTMPEVDQRIGGTPPGDFDADRAELKALIARFTSQPQDGVHAAFGRLSPRQWWRWGYLHCDHHLRQFGE